MKEGYYIGIMSGTSFDGVDIALCHISQNSSQLIDSYEMPFDMRLKKELLKAIQTPLTLQKIGELDIALAKLYLKAIQEFFHNHTTIKKEAIIAIGLHGQTLWHQPNAIHSFSLQLGSGAYLYAQTGIKVVNDFRNVDVALGGNGAPFAPAFHKEVLLSSTLTRAVVNIGGMANITILANEETIGWDSGCGNVLLDLWSMQKRELPYDKDAKFAQEGKLSQELLTQMLQDHYFQLPPPKSTGREYFNSDWLENHLKEFTHLNDADIQRTLVELTAKTIVDDIKKFPVEQIILCGGGAKNPLLKQRIETLSQRDVILSDKLGISSDFMEAMAFAWLAYKRINNQKVSLKEITGATKDAILGALYG